MVKNVWKIVNMNFERPLGSFAQVWIKKLEEMIKKDRSSMYQLTLKTDCDPWKHYPLKIQTFILILIYIVDLFEINWIRL